MLTLYTRFDSKFMLICDKMSSCSVSPNSASYKGHVVWSNPLNPSWRSKFSVFWYILCYWGGGGKLQQIKITRVKKLRATCTRGNDWYHLSQLLASPLPSKIIKDYKFQKNNFFPPVVFSCFKPGFTHERDIIGSLFSRIGCRRRCLELRGRI
jgi:hypothetical protein